ncbi:DUF948 domain-containing protein [Nicoliella spurrieriana]|uniref:DUF948 domain-containing protein n=1 Tax=Nicoliella spurrieriana TaxID=2925830 RepID=A0A976RRZ9_9LACO|nr:DUF948 domain-containing protein [Nicoliella spurrieriana]UQS86778.1 DUF948 domain-containing protein [Nicoliella spurrieriana]
MTAGIIAALAFLLLVIFIGVFLLKLVTTLNEVNQSLKSITDDVDVLASQTEKVLASSNSMLKDLNDKVNTIDPVFQAAADLGVSVSELNDSTKNLTGRVKNGGKMGFGTKLMSLAGASIFGNSKKKNKNKK